MSDTITIVGTVGTDPETKTPTGFPITTFRVASSQRRFDRTTGAWTESGTNWYTASAYRRLAENAYTSLRKGDRVILTGRLRVRNWEAGEKRGTSVDIDVEAIGHDLLWGTSTFARASAPASVETTSRSRADAAWSSPTPVENAAVDPEWGSPGVEPKADREVDPRRPDDQDRVRAEERAPSLALAGGETPF